MMKYIASRLSEGNKIFPAEIYLETTGITIKIPGLFSGESKHFDFNHIASVEIDTPLIGFSTITFFAGGTQMSAHGFTKKEAQEIKEGIEKEKLLLKQSTNASQSQPNSAKLSVADEIIKLKGLLDCGALTQQEFDTQKAKILNN